MHGTHMNRTSCASSLIHLPKAMRDFLSILHSRQFELLVFLGMGSLALCILQFSGQAIYDEGHYLYNTLSFTDGSLKWWAFDTHRGPTGPLYAWVHSLVWNCLPGVPMLRWMNFILFGLSIALVSRTSNGWNWQRGLLLLAFPGIFVSAGLALTEMISVFFISLSLCLLEFNPQRKATGGVLLGLAALSRQTLITQVAAMPMTDFIRGQNKSTLMRTLLGTLLTVAITAPMFLGWRGLLPLDESQESIQSHSPLNPLNITLGFGYLAIIGGLIWKFTIRLERRHLWIATSTLLLGLGLSAALDWKYLPLKSTMIRLFGDSAEWLSYGLPGLSSGIVIAGTYWLFLNRQRLFTLRMTGTACWTFSLISVAILVLTNGGIAHQFSTRYLVVGAPYFAVVFGQFPARISGFLLLMIGNVLSLLSYA